jgi:riboflavin kinase / FMN adenylyltransferase
MFTFRKLDEIPSDFGPTVVSVGNFDGVHRAHQYVIGEMVRRARALNARAVAVTFDPHPIRILRPREAPPLITPVPQKLRLLEQTGLDAVVMLPFSRDLSMMPPFEFAETILSDGLGAIEVHEGFNFRFGHRAEGTMTRLLEYGRKLGFEVIEYQPQKIRGHIVSSSEIRKLIQAGNMDRPRHLLGRPFSIFSNPGAGRGYGHRYTVPTINLARYDELVPGIGVYVTRIAVAGEVFNAVTNVGNRPTFGPDSFAIETHILDFHPIELSDDSPIELTFLYRLRDERKFESTDALKEQIGCDVKSANRYFHLCGRFTLG